MGKRGQIPWNKGKRLHYDVWMKGKKHKKESNLKNRIAHLGKPSANKGKHLSESQKQRLREVNLGKKRSQKVKDKIRQTMKGKKQYEMTDEVRKKISKSKKGQLPWITGRHHSEETRKKISLSQIGSKSYRWKGGVTSVNKKIRHSLEYRLWREAVFKRDNYTCVWCGDHTHKGRGGTIVLNADHIKPFSLYPELRLALDNGRTLCESCHHKTDTFMGRIKKYIKNNK